ncbi:hypothetical protein GLYMA_06G212101v4 [Glycine max]|nr:hypothetical protein GLYMA_06G212101v4 [Glycine max]KAH1126981.1 hypothetical protein GYH30_015811 [Glycine max]
MKLFRSFEFIVSLGVINFFLWPLQDYKQQRPSQELVAKDLHGVEWKFQHIYRGQPRWHLLTVFLLAKRILFLEMQFSFLACRGCRCNYTLELSPCYNYSKGIFSFESSLSYIYPFSL